MNVSHAFGSNEILTDEEPPSGRFKFQQYEWLDEERGVPLYWEWDDHGKQTEICTSLGADAFTNSQKGALVRIALHAHHEALVKNRAIHYSRSKSARIWATPRIRKLSYYSLPLIVHAIDFLCRHGFIIHETATIGTKGKQSEFRATNRLLMNIAKFEYGILAPKHPIILRDTTEEELELPNTRLVDRMAKRVDAQNNLILNTEFTALPELRAPMTRIFRRDMNHLGRFYCVGASWQNVRRKTRELIQLEGERTTLLDFSACNPHIAYRLIEVVPLDDPYQCDGFNRSDAKLGLMILLNAVNKQEAIYALAHDEKFMCELGCNTRRPDLWRCRQMAALLVDQLEQLHAPLVEAGMFFGSGLRLMRAESDIADGVMTDLRNLGIISLPIHDGFMVQDRHAGILREAMHERSKMGTSNAIPIKIEF